MSMPPGVFQILITFPETILRSTLTHLIIVTQLARRVQHRKSSAFSLDQMNLWAQYGMSDDDDVIVRVYFLLQNQISKES
jgi:hypothetical protein